MRSISNETLEVIGVVLGLFLLALLWLSCQLNPRAILGMYGRRRSNTGNSRNDEPHHYASMNDFVIGAEDDERPGVVTVAGDTQQTMTMRDIFPDILGEEKKDSGSGDEENLNEPLL